MAKGDYQIMKWGWPLVAIFMAGCTEIPTLTPTELNEHAEEYDGKEVRLRGVLVYQFEDIGIWDSKDAHDDPHLGGDAGLFSKLNGASSGWPHSCVSYSGPDLRKRIVSRVLVFHGVFRKNILPPNVVSNGLCNDSGLEVDRLPAKLF